jgi:diguanylate cyclase (GGDEF)-like protein
MLIFVLIGTAVGVGFYVHSTLSQVRQSLPTEIWRQADAIYLVTDELKALVHAVELAKLDTSPQRSAAVITHVQALQEQLIAVRNTYVLDNLLGAAGLHAVVNPAVEDIYRWMTQGIPGIAAGSPRLMRLVEIRAKAVYAQALGLSRQAHVVSQELLIQGTLRLARFQDVMMLLLAVLLAFTLLVVYLFLRKRRIKARLAILREQLVDAIENIPEGFILCDARDRLIVCNESYRRMYSHIQDWLVPGTPFVQLTQALVASYLVRKDEPHYHTLVERMLRHRHSSASFELEMRDGRRIRISERRTLEGGIVGMHTDITDICRTQERLYFLANHDVLTGLPNRGYCQDRLEKVLARAHRHKTQFALLYLDLDRFKWINDTFGHQAGDTLLRIVAERLKDCLRNEDTLARLGGDEFMLILEDLINDSVLAATASAIRLIESLTKPIQLGTNEVFITTSIGIACYPLHSSDLKTLIQCADLAGYYAKSQGPNNYAVYSPDLTGFSLQRIGA